jgi:hypothetical protein
MMIINNNNLRAISFNRYQLKLFIPARSTVLDNPEDYIHEEKTWYRCPEHEQANAIGLKYDIWYVLCNI